MAALGWLKFLVRIISLGVIQKGKQSGWIDPEASKKPDIKVK